MARDESSKVKIYGFYVITAYVPISENMLPIIKAHIFIDELSPFYIHWTDTTKASFNLD